MYGLTNNIDICSALASLFKGPIVCTGLYKNLRSLLSIKIMLYELIIVYLQFALVIYKSGLCPPPPIMFPY